MEEESDGDDDLSQCPYCDDNHSLEEVEDENPTELGDDGEGHESGIVLYEDDLKDLN